jgi:spore coat protein CotH
LAFGNNLSDASYLRDALSYDIMAAAGLVTPKTAFYEVVVDYGEGPVSLGLYTAVEVVDDTVIERYFANSNGNIYEGDGVAASLAAGTKDQIKTSFQKENNRAAANWSDIQRLYDVLHSDRRTSNAAVWRAKLEAVFDVDAFLEWLAVSTVIQDWDAYGTMSHNYYLYHDPASGRLVWISWDHNEALGVSGRGDTSLNKASIGQNWPLIRFLLDDPIYQAKYTGYLRDCLADAFVPAQLTEKTDAWAALLRPYADKEGKSQAFESAISQLKTLLTQRAAAVEGYLAGQK